jgi:hypothetical protein
MEPGELLAHLIESLEGLGLPYLVTGSTASAAYGDPRWTNDIDIVVDLPAAQIAAFCAAFPEDRFYLSKEAVADAVRQRHQFNILHPQSGLKVDVIVASDSEFDHSRLRRGLRLKVLPDREVTFAAPEDVILMKMVYYREGGSEKHLRDIAGVLRVRGEQLDRDYLSTWATRLDVAEIWQTVLTKAAP